MKYSPIVLVVLISTIAVTESAIANPEPITTTGESNQATILMTQPATINNKWNSVINQTNNFRQTAGSISVAQERGCQNIDPFKFIENPDAILKCQKQTNNQNSQRTEPIEYLKVPRLDSGINVTVTKF